jgi:hypothetical protein
MVVWVSVFILFVYVTLYNLSARNIETPAWLRPTAEVAVRFHGVLLTTAIIAVIVLIGEAFWSYWSTLL